MDRISVVGRCGYCGGLVVAALTPYGDLSQSAGCTTCGGTTETPCPTLPTLHVANPDPTGRLRRTSLFHRGMTEHYFRQDNKNGA